MAYSAMTLLPYSDKAFSCYQSASAQETRFGIGQQFQASIILSSFVEKLETVKIMYAYKYNGILYFVRLKNVYKL